VWDFANTPKENYPLLLNYHPMVIYRHQVCKQADVVLALLLLSDQFTLEDKRRDFDYYEAVTTHDSSLSSCIFSIIAAEVGYQDKAYDYFMETARLDLDDTHGNTHYGVHTAAMAGTWMGVAYGFAGMRVVGGELKFRAVAAGASGSTTRSRFISRVRCWKCTWSRAARSTRLLQGEVLDFMHGDEAVALTLSQPKQSRRSMSQLSRFKAVIFDLDGVITDTAHYHYLAWKRLAESQGVHFDHAFNENLKGIDRMGSLDLILAGARRTYSPEEKLALADEKNLHYQELISTMSSTDLLPGAVAALDKVRAAGLRIGLASVSKNAFTVLGRLGITRQIRLRGGCGDNRARQADPEIF
jgi:beta-phosphoglucomutase